MEYTTVSPVVLLLNARKMRGDGEAAHGEFAAVMHKLAPNGGAHNVIITNSRSKTGGALGMPEAAASASPARVNPEFRK